MRILTFSTLYPNAAGPNYGVFVENRLRHLLAFAGGAIEATVLSPQPWFPGRHPVLGTWQGSPAIPAREIRHGIEVFRPRFLALPGIGMPIAPLLLYAAALPALRALHRQGRRFDLIDAHYLYPAGVAATWLGRRFGLPVVLTARGSDVTEFPAYPVPRALIRRAAASAAAIVTVSRGLKDGLVAIGVPPASITVLRNGVDLTLFTPQDQPACRAAMAVSGPVAVSVGGLIPRKGHDLTIAALALLPGWTLLIAGEGPEHVALEAQAARLGVADRVRFLGAVPHAELPRLYGAADLSVLSSTREGWANVLLESMACGTPVVASPIPGNDEVVQGGASGLIAAARTPRAVADGMLELTARLPARGETAAYAARFGWDETSEGQMKLFGKIKPGVWGDGSSPQDLTDQVWGDGSSPQDLKFDAP
jgi:teichuronic acid biosynthesis glycosyltransferase TuaC